MSNAKLKEQIEAAKIALVHSAEANSYGETQASSDTIAQIPSIDNDDANPHAASITNSDKTGDIGRVAKMTHSSSSAETKLLGQDTIPQGDFEKLEARLQSLETQIKNQQRDLHTLLQKLRDISAKNQAVFESKKSKSTKKWWAGAALCIIGSVTVYLWLGAEVITSTMYQATSLIVALIDSLASRI